MPPQPTTRRLEQQCVSWSRLSQVVFGISAGWIARIVSVLGQRSSRVRTQFSLRLKLVSSRSLLSVCPLPHGRGAGCSPMPEQPTAASHAASSSPAATESDSGKRATLSKAHRYCLKFLYHCCDHLPFCFRGWQLVFPVSRERRYLPLLFDLQVC